MLEYYSIAPWINRRALRNSMPQKLPEIEITNVRPLFSLRRLAQFFDLYTEDGRPATDSILEWWHSGRIPPPDVRISRKAVFGLHETIDEFVRNGGIR